MSYLNAIYQMETQKLPLRLDIKAFLTRYVRALDDEIPVIFCCQPRLSIADFESDSE